MHNWQISCLEVQIKVNNFCLPSKISRLATKFCGGAASRVAECGITTSDRYAK